MSVQGGPALPVIYTNSRATQAGPAQPVILVGADGATPLTTLPSAASALALIAGWYNVKAYGALGDGATDDAAAIAAAMTAAGAGGTVFFPPGVYLIQSSITVSLTGIRLIGASNQTSIIKQGGSYSVSGTGSLAITGSKAYIADLGFRGFGSGAADPAIVTVGATDVLIERCRSESTTSRLVIFTAASHRSKITHSLCEGTGGTSPSNAIEINGSNYCSVEFNTILATGGTAGSGGNAIEIYQASASTQIYGTRVVGNIIAGSNGAGIITFGDYDSLISDNVILSTSNAGIQLRKGEVDTALFSWNAAVLGNAIKGCGATSNLHGIFLDAESKAAVVSGNTIEGSGGASNGVGIAVYGTAHEVLGNTVTLSATHGIYVQGTKNVIANNVVSNNSTIANSSDGIRTSNATQCVFLGNRVFDDRGTQLQQQGIQMPSGSNNNVLIANELIGNKFNGIIDGGTGNIKIANVGYVGQNSGTATVANGSTSIVVSHGLATTPTRVFLTPTNTLGSATKFYVDTLTSSQFTIHTDVDPGATTAIFAWHAQIGEG